MEAQRDTKKKRIGELGWHDPLETFPILEGRPTGTGDTPVARSPEPEALPIGTAPKILSTLLDTRRLPCAWERRPCVAAKCTQRSHGSLPQTARAH